ncbi:MAG TPA: TIGR01777 family oxidoreductase [Gaiellaceae bacterium]
MKVVVSGASGLIGSELVPALRASGHEVIRLVRSEVAGVDEVAWNPAAGSLDAHLLEGVDAIVNLSGENIGQRWTASRKREILDSRLAATGLLAQTAVALDPRPSVFVSAGGVGVYGDRGDEIVTEESTLGTGFEADVVRAWEAAAAPARDAGIRVVNFRQGMVLAKEGGALARMLLPFKLGVGGRVGSGKQWWTWVAIDDVTAAYGFVLGHEIDGVVNLAAPNPVTNAQFADALGKALGRPTILPTPAFAIRALFGEMGEDVLLCGRRALPARLIEAGFTFSAPTIETALSHVLTSR